jgi:hypothetical protein
MLPGERFDQGMKFSRPFLNPRKRLFADLELFRIARFDLGFV